MRKSVLKGSALKRSITTPQADEAATQRCFLAAERGGTSEPDLDIGLVVRPDARGQGPEKRLEYLAKWGYGPSLLTRARFSM